MNLVSTKNYMHQILHCMNNLVLTYNLDVYLHLLHTNNDPGTNSYVHQCNT